MSVTRRTYTVGGETRTARRFTARFTDHNRVERRVPAYADKAASAELSRKLSRLASLRAAGEPVPPELSRWIDALPAAVQAKLARWGMIDVRRLAAAADLAHHVADYGQHLLDAGRTRQHAGQTAARAAALARVCGFTLAGDINAEAVTRGVAKLRDGTADLSAKPGRRGRVAGGSNGDVKGVSDATAGHYLTAFKMFCRWMLAAERAADTPRLSAVTRMRAVNVVDKRHRRRPLVPDELRRLVAAAEAGPVRGRVGGPARALLYRMAAETGLRAGELRKLRRCDLALSGDAPTVTLPAAASKNRKAATLPLRPGTAAAVADFTAGLMPAAAAFKLPARQHVSRVLRADLADARAAWLAEAEDAAERIDRGGGDYLAEADATGRVVDFHALRHTFVTNLAAAGVAPAMLQRLARHSTSRLTLDVYTHVRAEGMAEAVAALPDTLAAAPVRRATGTHGGRADVLVMKLDGWDGLHARENVPKVAPAQTLQTVTNGHSDAPHARRTASAESAEKPVKTPDSRGEPGKAGAGFEPANNGFAIRPLSPLGYPASCAGSVRCR